MSNETDLVDATVKEVVREERLQPSYKLWAFWAVAAPAYIYFFGYNARYYFIDSLGFDVAEISSDPSSVYHFAFHSLGFMVLRGIEYLATEFLNQFIQHWVFYSIVTFLVGFAVYLGFLIPKWWRECSGGGEYRGLLSFLLRIVDVLKEWLGNNHHVKYGLFSFSISVSYFVTNLLITPVVVFVLTVILFIFSPAVLVGSGMAKYEKEHFNCEFSQKSSISIPPCNTLILSDSTVRVGKIMHRDSQYVFLYTEYGPLTIPLGSIDYIQRLRVN